MSIIGRCAVILDERKTALEGVAGGFSRSDSTDRNHPLAQSWSHLCHGARLGVPFQLQDLVAWLWSGALAVSRLSGHGRVC